MRFRTKRLRMWGVLGLALALAVVIGYGQPPPRTPADTGALDWFIRQLAPCFEILKPRVYRECTFPAGHYCLYYTGEPGRLVVDASLHTFGWYSETVGCGALYTIVRGQSYSRHDQRSIPGLDPYAVLPCARLGWGLRIPPAFGRIGFWLNNPSPPTGPDITRGGLYYTCTPRNWDNRQHAFIYEVDYRLRRVCLIAPRVRCECDCGCVLPPEGKMYLIFWEDWCGGGDWDWNDFMVAVIPCMMHVPPPPTK